MADNERQAVPFDDALRKLLSAKPPKKDEKPKPKAPAQGKKA
jgi:hypothetical protein